MRKIAFILITCLLAACSTEVSPLVKGTAAGGVVGAGTGAIVGSVIANGDVTSSALLGAGVGSAVGLAGTYAIKEYREHKEIKKNNEVIKENYNEITSNQQAIELYRDELLKDSRQIEPTAENPRHF